MSPLRSANPAVARFRMVQALLLGGKLAVLLLALYLLSIYRPNL